MVKTEIQTYCQISYALFIITRLSTFFKVQAGFFVVEFLLCDAMQSSYATASRPSVCLPSGMFRYVFHTGWNTVKIA